jgi:hypothetical protein
MADEFKSGVDTKWLQESGVLAAKDHMTVKDYLQIESQSEEKLDKVREPALRVLRNLCRSGSTRIYIPMEKK